MNNNPRDPRYNNYRNGNPPPQGNGQPYNRPNTHPNGYNGTDPSRQMPRNGAQRTQSSGQNRGAVPNNQFPSVRHRSRKQARRAALTLGLVSVILVLLLISVVIFAARCAVNMSAGDDTGDGHTITDSLSQMQDSGFVTAPAVTEPPVETEPPLDPNYEYITLTDADVYKGYQLLINFDHPYNFTGDFDFKTLFSTKNGLYKVSNITDSLDSEALAGFVNMMAALKNETGNDDIIVTSSDRTYEFQEQLYNERVDMYGEEFAQLYVAKPGHSEHHTGLALDLAIYTDGGKAFTFDDKPEYPDWLRANAHKYGYIERYTAEKTAITKIAFENWHYRYIGKPHAYYIKTNALCLEEYIDTLRLYSFNEPHLIFTDDEGVSWELYYVKADESGTTKVPVPRTAPYEISGNNVDGYIVTVQQ